MLFSTPTDYAAFRLGYEDGVRLLIGAGYPALDLSFFGGSECCRIPDEGTARTLRRIADGAGVIFNQAHAPFGGGYDHYTGKLVPQMPTVFARAAVLGVRQIVVHPLQRGRYYGHEQELFDMNVDFYRSLAPYAREYGLKIAIENMWQTDSRARHIVDDVCADPRELAALYDALDDPDAFTVCLDIGHVALCGREPEDAILLLGHDRLGALHVHDVDYRDDLHTLPGVGLIRWKAVTDALGAIDYKGELTLEADNFLRGFSDCMPTAARFMADRARQLAAAVDAARPHN